MRERKFFQFQKRGDASNWLKPPPRALRPAISTPHSSKSKSQHAQATRTLLYSPTTTARETASTPRGLNFGKRKNSRVALVDAEEIKKKTFAFALLTETKMAPSWWNTSGAVKGYTAAQKASLKVRTLAGGIGRDEREFAQAN